MNGFGFESSHSLDLDAFQRGIENTYLKLRDEKLKEPVSADAEDIGKTEGIRVIPMSCDQVDSATGDGSGESVAGGRGSDGYDGDWSSDESVKTVAVVGQDAGGGSGAAAGKCKLGGRNDGGVTKLLKLTVAGVGGSSVAQAGFRQYT